MADATFEAQRMAELLAKANEELAQFGQITARTQNDITDSQVQAKTGLKNFTAGTAAAGQAVMSLAGAASAAGKAMLDGKKGAAAFNDTIDGMTDAVTALGVALSLLVPVIGPLVAVVVAATAAYAKYTKAANEMADKLYKGYSGLAKSGAAASDGMNGIFRDAKKLGLSMNELDGFVNMIAENSQDLALLSGTVYEGRQKFADMGKQLEGNREGFLKMGLSMQDVSDGMAGYLRTVTRTGRAQNMTNEQLAASARNYIYEQDNLAKITGLSAKKQQEITERALQNEQFLAKVRALEAAGETKKADELKKLNIYYSQMGEEAAAGFQASVNGNLRNKDAQRLNMTSQGEVLRGIQDIEAGTATAAEAFDRTAQNISKYEASTGRGLAALDAGAEVGLKYSTQVNFAIATGEKRIELEKKVNDELEKQGAKGGKAADAMLDKQGQLINTQIQANEAMERFIKEGISNAQDAMISLAKATRAGAGALADLVGGQGLTDAQKQQDDKNWDKMNVLEKTESGLARGIEKLTGLFSDNLKNKQEKERFAAESKYLEEKEGGKKTAEVNGKVPKAADGGMLSGPKSGYMAMLHGNELVIPEDMLSGTMESLGEGASGTGGSKEKMDQMLKEIVKDTKTLEKLTDQDTKKAERYNRVYSEFVNLKAKLMEDEIDLQKEQLELLEKVSTESPSIANMMKQQMRNMMTGGLTQAEFDKMIQKAKENGGQWSTNTSSSSSSSSKTGTSGGPNMPSSSASASSGTGLKLPAPGPGMQMTSASGQGLKASSQDDLKGQGLKIKTGDVQAKDAGISPKIIDMAKEVQNGVPGFSYFSAFNDKFHQEKAPTSKHAQGLAMDFTVAQPPSKEDGKAVTDWLKQMGASLAIDEYNNPSSKATGGHYHAQIPAFGDGGMVDKATLALIGEKRPEAVIPLDNGAVPVRLEGGNMGGDSTELVAQLKTMMEALTAKLDNAPMLAMMEELVRINKNGNDISTKMLRTAQN